MATVYFSLGTNLGDKKQNISRAISLVNERVGVVIKQSSLYETKPWGFNSNNNFLNACIACQSSLSPFEILKATQQIEKEMGRTKKSHNGNYADRVIDIDILTYDDEQIDTPELKIPHPLMHKRDFVMIPLNEILDK